ncbi:MAG: hypothetical protein A3C88_02450 [Candidatus Yanofskybacteria bacterium RIFCSPHIGHO2_02_FULL_50_12]|uniref:Uncharacterized protein n=1 Tax=Candidatus Yanofskybacteria bacterium RIFCSPHIGHO2_02_FULL_50_12 TaxID=1802685 RepID=A0A1F8FX93_9BACT|nr:MAG: hypothetical protein A3C88_02450 [Candidatus Yanofskybacteria bacterium RIFCSPHIGHO2_02_FULL_50_12]
MGNTRRDNREARKKQGPGATEKFKDRQHHRHTHHTRAWWITFSCGEEDYLPFAGSIEVDTIAMTEHQKKHPGKYHSECTITKHDPVKL